MRFPVRSPPLARPSLSCQVDRRPELYRPEWAAAAAARYERYWLPLLRKYGAGGAGSGCRAGLASFAGLAPPLDVAWVWLVHLLCPTQYAQARLPRT